MTGRVVTIASLMVFSGNANLRLASSIAHELNVPVGKAVVGRFSDGEVMVEIMENVRGRDVFVVQPTCAPTNNSVSASGFDEFGTPVSAGPAEALVTITAPALSVTKTLISPNPGPAYVGDPVTFRITLENTGTSAITTLPLADIFSAACFDYQSATVAPDGIGADLLLWNNLGPLAVSASTNLDVTLTVTGECTPALNTADVSFAVDENGDSVPSVQDSAVLQTIGAKIGDRIWNDRDGDGVQDAGEGGLANVIVFIDVNDDGSRDAGEPFDTTDATGAYDITDLAAGNYTVRVDAATLPAGGQGPQCRRRTL
mgnify:CR=1 FL=1